MNRVYNFSAGPSMLFEDVLKQAQSEMMNYKDSGMSVMEMSHRSKTYQAIIDEAEADLREIMAIPANYKVLFLQGGASTQFAMIPLNLFNGSKKADFVNTGAWSKKAIAEAKRYGTANVIASSEDKTFSYIPKVTKDMLDPQADYVHITSNNTIYGTVFTELPDTGKVPLVADMSSNILSQVYDVSKFGLIYAGAQKNIGPAGVTVVIIREDLIGKAMDICPTMLNYQTHAEEGSMFNTPPTFAIYVAGLTFKYLKKNGGIAAMEKINRAKAARLYKAIDDSSLFSCPTNVKDRSIMNVPFVTGNDDLDAKFIKEATAQGLTTLKGHRSVGGMRASIYNAMPEAGVDKLISFMQQFEKENK